MSELPDELARYQEMLRPLVEIPTDGPAALAGEDVPAWEQAMATLRGYHGDHLDLEEAVAAFARALWAAPGWAEPPARIAEALLVRSKHWPAAQRDEAQALASAFAQRAHAVDAAHPAARAAYARAKLATGAVGEAEKAASILPGESAASAAVRAEVAEAKGERTQALLLREQQVALERDPASLRDARNKLGLLYQAAGRVDEAIATHLKNLAAHPDYAWAHVNLASSLEAKGQILEAYAEVETALLLGLEEARPFLDELAVALDRRALEGFRTLLRSGRDGDAVDLCPSAAA